MNTTNELLNKCLKRSGITVIVLLLATFAFLTCTIYIGQRTLKQYRGQAELTSDINKAKLGNEIHLTALKELAIAKTNHFLVMCVLNTGLFGLLCFLSGAIFFSYYSQRKRLIKLSKMLESPKEKEENKL